ncbi:MAG: flagellar basal body-associated FliL family protein [Epulopiscium sp.]|nr:flagellar basal body-associated FliL family protein [Candidatus Epulonipiscium sp.]
MEKNKLLLIGVLLIALVSVTAALFYVSTILNRVASSNPNHGGNGYEVLNGKVPLKDIKIIAIEEPITTNLLSEDEKKQHIVRVTASIGINSESKQAKKTIQQVEEQNIAIRDIIIEILKTKTFEEMARPDAHQGLKEEILKELQENFQTNVICDVYLGEFFVQ